MWQTILIILVFILAICVAVVLARRYRGGFTGGGEEYDIPAPCVSLGALPANRIGGIRDIPSTVRGSGQSSRLRKKDLSAHPRTKSEARVIAVLEDIFRGHEFPTAYPSWLRWKGANLELDGYNEELGIALEFSGPMHTKWSPKQEDYYSYFTRVVRDIAKRKLCKKHGVHLIVIDMSLPTHHVRNYILSRLGDFGVQHSAAITAGAPGYIAEQTAVPFRNKQLEREFHLEGEMKAVKALA